MTDTKKPLRITVLLAATLGMVGCGHDEAPAESPQRRAPQSVGADRDEHGCIGSAGYTWCARTNQCERPWELAKARGLVEGAVAYQQFCSASRDP